MSSPLPPAPARSKRRWTGLRWLLAAGALVAAVAAGAPWTRASRAPAPADLPTEPVRRERLQPTVAARGSVESAESADVVCRVRSWVRGRTFSTTIKWLVDNGSLVTKGQMVGELDDSSLQEELSERKGPLELARSAWVFAEENAAIVKGQSEGEIRTAEVAVTLAELDLQKYRDGDYRQTRRDVESRLAQAESDLEMSSGRADWSEQMVRKGYAGGTQSRADRARVQAARVTLERVREEYRVLEKYTRRRTQREREARLEEARAELRRARLQAKARQAKADADRFTKQRTYQRRLSRFREIEDEVFRCVLTAPHDGLAVYAVPDQAWGAGAQSAVIAAGEPVRWGQKVLSIPNLSKMEVRVGVHEAIAPQVRGDQLRETGFGEAVEATLLAAPDPAARLAGPFALAEVRDRFHDQDWARVAPGQPALVRVDAFPGRVLAGHVRQVAEVASQLDTLDRDAAVHATAVMIDDACPGLRPNMSADVTIFTDETPAVLAVPVKALVRAPDDGACTCFVLTPDGPEPRIVVVGAHTDERAEVRSGVREGEQVVVEPGRLKEG